MTPSQQKQLECLPQVIDGHLLAKAGVTVASIPPAFFINQTLYNFFLLHNTTLNLYGSFLAILSVSSCLCLGLLHLYIILYIILLQESLQLRNRIVSQKRVAVTGMMCVKTSIFTTFKTVTLLE